MFYSFQKLWHKNLIKLNVVRRIPMSSCAWLVGPYRTWSFHSVNWSECRTMRKCPCTGCGCVIRKATEYSIPLGTNQPTASPLSKQRHLMHKRYLKWSIYESIRISCCSHHPPPPLGTHVMITMEEDRVVGTNPFCPRTNDGHDLQVCRNFCSPKNKAASAVYPSHNESGVAQHFRDLI